MTKRILILFMVVAIVLAFAACTEVNTTAKPKATTPATTKATTVATTTEATTKATTEDTTVPTTAPTTAPTTVTTVTTTPTTPTTVTTVTTATSATTAATTTAATTTAATTTAATTTAATTTAATTTAATTTAATTTAATTTAATTTAATTTAATTTAATTTAATTTAATTEATTVTTVPVVVPEAYVDIDFGADAITDKKGNASFKKVGTPVIGNTTVTHDGVTRDVAALNIKAAGNFVVGTFDKIETIDAMNEMLAAGFSIEAFYLDNSTAASAVFCMTEKPNGFGIAHQKNTNTSQNNKPYFITGNGDTANAWNAVYPTETISDTELVHVVAVYNPTAKTHTIYINGKLSNTTANVPCVKAATTTSSANTGNTVMFNTFGLGGDLSPNAVVNKKTYIGDFLATDMTIVDAKFYTCVLTADQIAEAYKVATEDLENVTPTAYVDVDFGTDTITDKQGNASFKNVGTPVVASKTVTHNGVSKEVSALSIASAGNFVVGTFDKIETIDAMNEMLAAGFSIEAFYLDNSTAASAVFCMTEKPNGFGIAHQKNGYASQNNKPYFITGNGDTANAWNAVYPTETISDTELVHVVAVYNPTAKTHTIYINGKLSNTTANVPCVKAATTTSSVHTGETPMFNTFGLGGDLSPTATKNNKNYIGDFLATDMTIVDAKFYTCVLTAEQVAEAYKTATAGFVAAE